MFTDNILLNWPATGHWATPSPRRAECCPRRRPTSVPRVARWATTRWPDSHRLHQCRRAVSGLHSIRVEFINGRHVTAATTTTTGSVRLVHRRYTSSQVRIPPSRRLAVLHRIDCNSFRDRPTSQRPSRLTTLAPATPPLYVLNAASVAKPHAIEFLTAELSGIMPTSP